MISQPMLQLSEYPARYTKHFHGEASFSSTALIARQIMATYSMAIGGRQSCKGELFIYGINGFQSWKLMME